MPTLDDIIKDINNKQFKRNYLSIDPVEFKNNLEAIGNAVVESGVFKIGKHNKTTYNMLVKYYVGSADFENKTYTLTVLEDGQEKKLTFNHSYKKGVCLCGNFGSGKSDCMTIFNYVSKRYGIGLHSNKINCKTLEVDFKAFGYEYLMRFKKGVWLLEDLGLEELQTKHFGTNDNIIEAVINMLYDNWRDTGTPVFITTNLNAKAMYERYGKRLAERIFEMCNFLTLAGENLRPDKIN